MDDDEAEVHQAFLAYLAENPAATDTLEGIAEWWIIRQRIHTSVTTVERVLRRLIEEGRVEELGSSQPPRYRIVRKNVDEVTS